MDTKLKKQVVGIGLNVRMQKLANIKK